MGVRLVPKTPKHTCAPPPTPGPPHFPHCINNPHSDPDRPKWEKAGDLLAAEAPIKAFLYKSAANGTIPLPGEVGAIAGGPPCQGVSGLNRCV